MKMKPDNPNRKWRKDLTGLRFGRLVVIREAGMGKGGVWLWLCICDCGKESVGRAGNLENGTKRSCGCLRNLGQSIKNQKYFVQWDGMIGRCHRFSNKDYHRYGAKGVSVCDEWRNNYWAYHKWMEDNGAKKGLSVDRFPDKNGNYDPSNCRIATYKEQNNNLRSNRLFTIDGLTKTMTQWSEEYGINPDYVGKRLKRGFDIVSALTTKVKIKNGTK